MKDKIKEDKKNVQGKNKKKWKKTRNEYWDIRYKGYVIELIINKHLDSCLRRCSTEVPI
jgi:hypothetical protein